MENISFFKEQDPDEQAKLQSIIDAEIKEKTDLFLLANSKYAKAQEREDQEMNIASQAMLFDKNLEFGKDIAAEAEQSFSVQRKKLHDLYASYKELNKEYFILAGRMDRESADQRKALAEKMRTIETQFRQLQDAIGETDQYNPQDN